MCPTSQTLDPYSDVHIDIVSCKRPTMSVAIPVANLSESWNSTIELTE